MDKTQNYQVGEEQRDSDNSPKQKGLLDRLGNSSIGMAVKAGVLGLTFWAGGVIVDYASQMIGLESNNASVYAERGGRSPAMTPCEQNARDLEKKGDYSSAETWRNIGAWGMAEYEKEEAIKKMKEKIRREREGDGPPVTSKKVRTLFLKNIKGLSRTGDIWTLQEGYEWVNPYNPNELSVRRVDREERREPARETTSRNEKSSLDRDGDGVVTADELMSEKEVEEFRNGRTNYNTEGFKEINTKYGAFCLATCTEAGDFDRNGSVDFPNDYKGVRTSFKIGDKIMLYCNGDKLRQGWRVLVTNTTEGKIVYDGTTDVNAWGINPQFDCRQFGAGDCNAVFFQGGKKIGSLEFEITNP